MKLLVLLVLLSLAYPLAALAGKPEGGLDVGDTAPPFKLAGSDGKTYELADLLGQRTVVLAWFPKAFTGG